MFDDLIKPNMLKKLYEDMKKDPEKYQKIDEKYVIKLLRRHSGDPVGYNVKGWYFFNEDWADVYGPYHSRIEADAQLKDYCEVYLGY
jgi:hypothetical protein